MRLGKVFCTTKGQQQSLYQPFQFGHPSAHLLHPLRLSLAQVGGDRSSPSATGYLVSSARQLRAKDVVGNTLVLRKATTKTKRTRLVPLHPKLKAVLGETGLPSSGYLFPGRGGQGPITRQACDTALRKACDLLGLRGYSTHSNRRTWATRLDKAGVRLKAIQDLGGWSSMAALQRYLEVSEDEKVDAIAQL